MSPPPRTAFLYTDGYARFDYGPSHPLRNVRLRLTHDLIRAHGLLDLPHARVVPTRPATMDEMAAFHSRPYLERLRGVDAGGAGPDLYAFGLGTGDNPIFPGVYEFSALVTGASLQAMELVVSGQVNAAFNIAGGLHHAHRAKASGFCYVNDPAVVIAHLVERGLRPAYVDIDVHHGDGVQGGFYDSDRTLTISLHESGHTLFPGTGFVEETGKGKGQGFSANVPFGPGTDDEVFTWAFDQVVPPLIAAFNPDVLVTQLGADTHRTDPLANLSLTTRGFAHAVRAFRAMGRPWVALGGGGYDVANVPRAWALAWAIMNDVAPPPGVPEAYRAACAAQDLRADPLLDEPYAVTGRAKAQAWSFARENVARLKHLVFPHHGLSSEAA
jgi:acetoin utilization protein AcuC